MFSGSTVERLAPGLLPQRIRYRQAAEPDASARFGFQLRQHSSRRRRAAVLHRERLCQHRGSDYGAARHDAEYVPGRTTRFRTSRGAHSFRVGGGFPAQSDQHDGGIASNGFFVFAPFPLSDSFASFLFGFPWCFFRRGGDMNRGLRNIDFARVRPGRMAGDAAADHQLRIALGSEHALYRYPKSDELLVARKAIDGVPECSGGAAVPGRQGRAGRHRSGVLEGPDAARGSGMGSHGFRARPRSARLTESSTTRSPTEWAVRCRRL